MNEEPKISGHDVALILKRRIRPGAPDEAEQRSKIAYHAGYSTETVKRAEDCKHEWLDLDKADRLCVAAGGHIGECEILPA